MASTIRIITILLYLCIWNRNKVLIRLFYFTRHPMAIEPISFCWGAILTMTTRHCSVIWHHPCVIKPLMNCLIIGRMVTVFIAINWIPNKANDDDYYNYRHGSNQHISGSKQLLNIHYKYSRFVLLTVMVHFV